MYKTSEVDMNVLIVGILLKQLCGVLFVYNSDDCEDRATFFLQDEIISIKHSRILHLISYVWWIMLYKI